MGSSELMCAGMHAMLLCFCFSLFLSFFFPFFFFFFSCFLTPPLLKGVFNSLYISLTLLASFFPNNHFFILLFAPIFLPFRRPLTTADMAKMDLQVTGQTGEAKLNVLRSLKIATITKSGWALL